MLHEEQQLQRERAAEAISKQQGGVRINTGKLVSLLQKYQKEDWVAKDKKELEIIQNILWRLNDNMINAQHRLEEVLGEDEGTS